MRRLIWLLCTIIGLTGLGYQMRPQPTSAWVQKVAPMVIDTLAEEGEAEFLVYLHTQANLTSAETLRTKEEKGRYVYETLTAVANTTQEPLIKELDALGADYRRYWVVNMIWVKGDQQILNAMASHPSVQSIEANPTVKMSHNGEIDPQRLQEAIESVGWNVSKVNATDVWAEGYTGQGIVVGGQDTGYRWDHSGLINQYRGWDGTTASHDYNWHDAVHSGGGSCGADAPAPCDDHGHGTHTMGSIVGNDMNPADVNWPAGANNAVGVAPGAKWIGCRNMDVGNGTPASYTECYEWFIAPYPVGGDPFTEGDPTKAPHVINNSWGCPPSEGCNANSLLTVVQNVRAAGIVTVHSAGNYGATGCSTVRDPSAIYDESFSVGSTTSTDSISSFSSRGPVAIDGSGRLKPDIVAPGSSIRSTTRTNTTSYGTSSGTSMAGPHVAGHVALLLSMQPTLAGHVDVIETLIQDTAVPLTSSQGCGGLPSTAVPNHVFGWGRIDAFATYEWLQNNGLQLSKTGANTAMVGQPITYTLSITNFSPLTLTNVILTDTIPTNTQFITATQPYTITGDVVQWEWATLNSSASASVELVVVAPEPNTSHVYNVDFGAIADNIEGVSAPPVTTKLQHSITYDLYIPIVQRSVAVK